MTIDKLYDFLDLVETRNRLSDTADSLRNRLGPAIGNYDAIPIKHKGTYRVIEENIAKLDELMLKIAELDQEIERRKPEIAEFCNLAPRVETRAAMRARFLYGLSWPEVPEYIYTRHKLFTLKKHCEAFISDFTDDE